MLFFKTLKQTQMELMFLEYSYYKLVNETDFSLRIEVKKKEAQELELKYEAEKILLKKKLIKAEIKTKLFEIEQLTKQKIKNKTVIVSFEELYAKEYNL